MMKQSLVNIQEQKKLGFSLVELILVVSLSVTISFMSVLGFVQFNNIQKVNNSVGEVVTMLQKAKSQSISQVKPKSVPVCAANSLGGYEIRLCGLPGSTCAGQGTYNLYVLCGGSNLIQSGTLAEGITFGDSSTTSFTFAILNGSVTPGTIIINGYGKTKTIQVTSIGNISVE